MAVEYIDDGIDSRFTEIMNAMINGEEYNKPAQSRMEALLLDLKEVIDEGGGGGAEENPILALVANSYKNDGAVAPSITHSVVDSGKYLVMSVFTATSSGTISGDFTRLSTTHNGTPITSTRILDDSELYSGKGMAIEVAVVDAEAGDSIVATTVGTSSKNGITASVFIFESLFYNLDQTNMSVIDQSPTYFNTTFQAFNIYLDQLMGRSCFGLTIARTNQAVAVNSSITISATGKTATAAAAQDVLFNPNDTTWKHRISVFYPQMFAGDQSVVTVKTPGVGGEATRTGKVVIIGV